MCFRECSCECSWYKYKYMWRVVATKIKSMCDQRTPTGRHRSHPCFSLASHVSTHRVDEYHIYNISAVAEGRRSGVVLWGYTRYMDLHQLRNLNYRFAMGWWWCW